jgi:hypothetical protein
VKENIQAPQIGALQMGPKEHNCDFLEKLKSILL